MEFKSEGIYFDVRSQQLLEYVGSSCANWDFNDPFRFKFKIIGDSNRFRETSKRYAVKNIINATKAQKLLYGNRED